MHRIALFTLPSLMACNLFKRPVDTATEDKYAPCVESSSSIDIDDASALGFSPQTMINSAGGERAETFVYADDSTTALNFSIVYSSGDLRFVDAERNPDAGGDTGVATMDAIWDSAAEYCPDRIEADVAYNFVTADGAFNESWDATLKSFDGAYSTIYLSFDPTALSGTYDMGAAVGGDYTSLSGWVDMSLSSDTSQGLVSGQAEHAEDCGDDDDCAVSVDYVEVGLWEPAASR